MKMFKRNKNIKVPKELGLKIGTVEEVYWTNVKGLEEDAIKKHKTAIQQVKQNLDDLEKGLKLHKNIYEMVELKIKAEQDKK